MNLLVVDDCRTTSRLVQRLLNKWGYPAQVASNGEDAIEIIQKSDGPWLVLLDWMMPGMDGPTVCRRIRQLNEKRYPYIIFLTALSDREHMLGALEAEADEFLRKPIDEEELRHRIQAGARILALQDRLLATQERLRIQATHDSLTGIWNRRAITDILLRELSRGRRKRQPTGLLIVDVDYFKSINDNYGHLVGDQVLRHLSKRLREVTRNYDSVGRFGGEEFLICLPETDIVSVRTVADRVCSEIRNTQFSADGSRIEVTVSIGMACTRPEDSNASSDSDIASCDALIKSADDALYEAKRLGRNRACSSDSPAGTPDTSTRTASYQPRLFSDFQA